MHVSEQDLILHFYGESEDDGIERHLASCQACRDEFARLRDMLRLVDTDEVPDPGPGFERQVWARLEPHLAPRRTSWFAWLAPARMPWVYAAGVASLLVVAFLAGRFTTPSPAPAAPSVAAAPQPDATERVLILAVGDHLDRSQMVLIELLNADLSSPVVNISDEQSRARDLVAANRLYRQTAAQAGDGTTGDVLDELGRVLIEIANTPEDASKAQIEALRDRIAARGLLFRVRVVNSEIRERERRTVAGSTS